MQIRKAEFHQFRNLAGAIEFGPSFNVLVGPNGQGKTNVLEAIYATCFGHSFRPGKLTDLVQFGRDGCFVRLEVEDRGQITPITMGFRPPERQKHGIGGQENASLNDVAAALRVIFFGPDDLGLVKGSPSLRRDFLDRAIWVHHPPYADLMKRYMKVLKARNRILKDWREGTPPVKEMLPTLDEELARYGAQVVSYRMRYLRDFTPIALRLVAEHTVGHLQLAIEYRTSLPNVIGHDWRPLHDAMLASLTASYAPSVAPAELPNTPVGPHLDDLYLSVNGKDARFFASQGEQRALAVSLKLAQLALWTERFDQRPILLLDDVSSELDRERTALLLATISAWGIQTVLTTTSPPDVLLGHKQTRFFDVRAGTVKVQSAPVVAGPLPGTEEENHE